MTDLQLFAFFILPLLVVGIGVLAAVVGPRLIAHYGSRSGK
jgi:hypothetical protein